MMKKVTLLLLTTISSFIFWGCSQPKTATDSAEEREKQEYAERVKSAFLKGWNAYTSYAYGMEDRKSVV